MTVKKKVTAANIGDVLRKQNKFMLIGGLIALFIILVAVFIIGSGGFVGGKKYERENQKLKEELEIIRREKVADSIKAAMFEESYIAEKSAYEQSRDEFQRTIRVLSQNKREYEKINSSYRDLYGDSLSRKFSATFGN